MSKTHIFHRENCTSSVRAIITDKLGRTITLMGKHAFEWKIVMEKDGRVVINQYPNRVAATREFEKYKK